VLNCKLTSRVSFIVCGRFFLFLVGKLVDCVQKRTIEQLFMTDRICKFAVGLLDEIPDPDGLVSEVLHRLP
jgi:hypothetical protein